MRHVAFVDPSGLMSARIDVYEFYRAYSFILQIMGLPSVCYSFQKFKKMST